MAQTTTEIQKQPQIVSAAGLLELSQFVTKSCEATGLTRASTEAIIKGWESPIRKMDSLSANLQVLTAVTRVSLDYGMRAEVPDRIYKECVSIVMEKFAHIGVDEIREAYRANAAGELDTKGKGEMYGGEFNAANFTAIIAAYCEKRRKVVAAYTNALHDAKEQAAAKEKRERLEREFEENFNDLLKQVAEKAEGWPDCPEYLYHSCEKRGLIELSVEEKKEIHGRAIECLRASRILEGMGEKGFTVSAMRASVNEVERQKVVARQIALWECVIMPMKLEIIS